MNSSTNDMGDEFKDGKNELSKKWLSTEKAQSVGLTVANITTRFVFWSWEKLVAWYTQPSDPTIKSLPERVIDSLMQREYSISHNICCVDLSNFETNKNFKRISFKKERKGHVNILVDRRCKFSVKCGLYTLYFIPSQNCIRVQCHFETCGAFLIQDSTDRLPIPSAPSLSPSIDEKLTFNPPPTNPYLEADAEDDKYSDKYEDVLWYSDTNFCVICYVQPQEYLLDSCGHVVVCESCKDEFAKTQTHCPICRLAFSKLIKVFHT
jgi:hypothetical protein